MTDIVERLRQVTEDDAYALPWTFGETCKEAADEIVRLRSLATQHHQGGAVVVGPQECVEKIDGMLRKLQALWVAFNMKGANATTIFRVINTLSTMKASLAAALAQQPKAEIRISKKTFVERLMENVADLRKLIGWQ